jgi:hypothetical protein
MPFLRRIDQLRVVAKAANSIYHADSWIGINDTSRPTAPEA